MSFEEMLAATVRVVVREEIRMLREELSEKRPADANYLSVAAAADLAGVSTKTIRVWIKSHALPGHRAGREHRVRRDELVRLIEHPPVPEGPLTPEDSAANVLKKLRGG